MLLLNRRQEIADQPPPSGVDPRQPYVLSVAQPQPNRAKLNTYALKCM